jgi:hypothetical protein
MGRVGEKKKDGLEPSEELEVDVADLEPDEQEMAQVQGGMGTLSNVVKKMSDTDSAIVQNLKLS